MPEVVLSTSEAEDLLFYLQGSSPALPPRLRALRNRLPGALRPSPALPPRLSAMKNRLEATSTEKSNSLSDITSAPVTSSAPVRNLVLDQEEDFVPRSSANEGESYQGELSLKANYAQTSSGEVDDLILELLEESGLNLKFAQLSSDARGLKRGAREWSPESSPESSPDPPGPSFPVPANANVNANANAQAPKECPRSGRPGKRRKRKAAQETAANPPQESEKYVGVSEPALPSVEILSQTSSWLAKIGSTHIRDTEIWIEELSNLMNGLEWASQTEALEDDSLLHVAQRCQRAETISSGANFVKIMAELFFAAKVNGILLHHALPQFLSQEAYRLEDRREIFRVSISSTMETLCDSGIPLSTSFNWYSAGSRWARLAASGSLYLLMIIASNSGLAASLRSSAVANSVILSLCNQIRQPQNPTSEFWVSQHLVPKVAKLQERIPLRIPSLYSPEVRKYFQVPSELDCRQLNLTDHYFDTFHQNIYLSLPRSQATWQTVASYQGKGVESLEMRDLESRYLTQSVDFEGCDRLSNFVEENKGAEIRANKFHISAPISSSCTVLPSSFRLPAALDAEPCPSSKEGRVKFTEKYRKAALKAKKPKSLQDLADKLQEHYYEDTGRLKGKSWHLISQDLIAGRELQVNDRDGNLLFYTDGTLSQELRDQLEQGLKTWSEAVSPSISGAEWLPRNSATSSTNEFSAFHFSYYSKYGVKGHEAPPDIHPLHLRRNGGLKTNTSQFFPHPSGDMQQFPEAYELLSNVFAKVIPSVVEKALQRHAQMFEEVVTNIDIIPLHDQSIAHPFPCFVVNFNVTTLFHKDPKDGCGCIVLVLGPHSGGELCLFEPRLVLQLKHGDWVVFPSHKISHFNLHYKGLRASIVIHSDRSGRAYQRDGNGWDGNRYYF